MINKSLDIDPSYSYAYKNKAKILIALNKKEEAIDNLEKSLELGYSEDYDDEVETLLSQINN